MASKDSTGGATPATGEAARPMTGVGGVRSSDDPVLDLWWSGQNMGERRDAACSAVEKRSKGRGDGPRGLPAPDKVRPLQITLYRKAKPIKFCLPTKEPGKPDAGKPPVRFDEGREADGHWLCLSLRRFLPTLHTNNTESFFAIRVIFCLLHKHDQKTTE